MTNKEAIFKLIKYRRRLEEDSTIDVEPFDLAIEALERKQWIPCSERLPSEDDSFNVLCCDKYGEIMIGHVFACDDSETFYSAESEHEYMYNCVAWRPLPEPWKGEKE